MKKLNSKKVPKDLRHALWDAYDRKCAYTGKLLEYDALQIDHIINKDLMTPEKKTVREKALLELSLPLDFNLYGVENLVPTSSTFNYAKNHRDITTSEKLRALAKASETSETVINLWERNEKESKLVKLADNLALQSSERDKRIVGEKIYRQMTQSQVTFEARTSISGDMLTVVKPDVYIICFPPKFPDYSGCLGININILPLSGATLSFSHREIMEILFSGLKTPPRLKAREFIVGFDESENNYLVQLGNSRFFLPSEVCLDLCTAIDEIAESFFSVIWNCETEIYRTIEFDRRSKSKTRLIKVPLWVWEKISEFVMRHDYDRGNGPWHIFDSNYNVVKVFAFDETERARDYRAFIYPEVDYPASCNDEHHRASGVWLCWDTSFTKSLSRRTEVSYKSGTLWNAQKTYEWLIKELLPEVLKTSEHKNSEKSFWRKKETKRTPPEDYIKNFEKSSGPKICATPPVTARALKDDLNNILSVMRFERTIPPTEILEVIQNIGLALSETQRNIRRLLGEQLEPDESNGNEFEKEVYEINCREILWYKVGQLLESLIAKIDELPVYEHERFMARLPTNIFSLYEWHNRQLMIKRCRNLY